MITEEEFSAQLKRLAEEAEQWRQSELEPDQEKATKYYQAKPFGNEEEGRSKVVLSDVRDTVLGILPSLLRVFFGSDRPVEFEPRHPDKAELARQQTDAINFVVAQDNPGFLEFQNWMKDALIRKIGVMKYWWEDIHEVEVEHFTGLSEEQVLVLESTKGVEVEFDNVRNHPDIMGESLYDVTAIRTLEHGDGIGRARFQTIPPEELLVSPQASRLDLTDCPFIAHRREVTAGDAIAMGIPEDLVRENQGRHGGLDQIRTGFGLRSARRIDDGSFVFSDSRPKSERLVLIMEAWIRIDADGDGISELREVLTIGPDYEIVRNIRVGERPLAVICPDPEPHTLVGNSVADVVMDLQLIKSQIARGMLDSLVASLNPEREFVEGEVNVADLMNSEIGKTIRVTKPNMIRDIVIPFVGGDALPVMQFFEGIREQRTGLSAASQGLDANALQSASKSAVAATMTASQQRIEMIARNFAETGVKQLYMGLLRLIHRHQDASRMIRLRGSFVEMDPRDWDLGMDVRINVALGQGSPEEKLQVLALVGQKQQELLQSGSPFVSNVEVRNTLARMVETAGFSNANEFWKPWGPQEEQAHQEMLAAQPPPPDPQMELIMIEKARLQAEIAKDEQELALRREEMILKDDRERDAQAQDAALKQFEIESKQAAEFKKAEVAARRKEVSAPKESE